jgi:hypothetical protein
MTGLSDERREALVTRDVTTGECPWLVNVPVPITAGMTVYHCHLPTYGAVRDFAATLDPDGGYPFFELPYDAIEVAQSDRAAMRGPS